MVITLWAVQSSVVTIVTIVLVTRIVNVFKREINERLDRVERSSVDQRRTQLQRPQVTTVKQERSRPTKKIQGYQIIRNRDSIVVCEVYAGWRQAKAVVEGLNKVREGVYAKKFTKIV